MMDIAWGEAVAGEVVRFGLVRPRHPFEAGATVALTLVAENLGKSDAWLFGFAPGYPRSLRVSPPKTDRPHIRVSFADVNVLHGFDAFTRLRPGQSITTTLDLSFAFDRRGVGVWPVAFAYDAVRASGGLTPWAPASGSTSTGRIELVVEASRSLRDAGIDLATELLLDESLSRGDAHLVEHVRALRGGALYAAWRSARVLAGGSESSLGWRAMDLLARLGEPGLAAAERVRAELPHADAALAFAAAWTAHRLGHQAPAAHLPFVTMLDELIAQPDRRGNFILGWTAYDSAIHGERRLQILGSGDAIIVTRGPHEPVPTTRRSRLNAMQMRAVLEALRYSAVWLLGPLRPVGIPDEPRPALEVRLALGDAYARQVAAWNGEWRQGPGAHIADLLDRICAEGAGARDSLRPSSY